MAATLKDSFGPDVAVGIADAIVGAARASIGR
jgi:hypothetical protein